MTLPTPDMPLGMSDDAAYQMQDSFMTDVAGNEYGRSVLQLRWSLAIHCMGTDPVVPDPVTAFRGGPTLALRH